DRAVTARQRQGEEAGAAVEIEGALAGPLPHHRLGERRQEPSVPLEEAAGVVGVAELPDLRGDLAVRQAGDERRRGPGAAVARRQIEPLAGLAGESRGQEWQRL